MSEHLSAQEISAWLSGERTPAREQHARECAECCAALERWQGSLAQFGGAVRGWSAREFERVRPVELPAHPRRWVGMLRLAAAATMVVALAAGPIWVKRRAAEKARQDEALLEQVQAEVSRAVPAPMEPLVSLWSSEGTTDARR